MQSRLPKEELGGLQVLPFKLIIAVTTGIHFLQVEEYLSLNDMPCSMSYHILPKLRCIGTTTSGSARRRSRRAPNQQSMRLRG
mmetsp:Transcript_9025/g.27563  ORF Transcript_9025/g.27563 Transcript_9025/m.27563 type:complete len:83 (+) Transcript_9025:192-440(+)